MCWRRALAFLVGAILRNVRHNRRPASSARSAGQADSCDALKPVSSHADAPTVNDYEMDTPTRGRWVRRFPWRSDYTVSQDDHGYLSVKCSKCDETIVKRGRSNFDINAAIEGHKQLGCER